MIGNRKVERNTTTTVTTSGANLEVGMAREQVVPEYIWGEEMKRLSNYYSLIIPGFMELPLTL